MPPPIKLQLFYDITSPWSYIAYEALCRYRSAWNIRLYLRPTFLGGVMVASKNTAPASVPNKARWMRRDLQLLSEIYNLNMRLPDGFPFKTPTLNTMRFLRVLQNVRPDLLEGATRQLWTEFFVKNTPVTSPEFLEALVPSLLSSEELAKLVAESQTSSNKERVKADAEKLVHEGGAFGMPWMVIERADGETESFFGSDRMPCISWWLGEDYPYTGPSPPSTGETSKL